MKTAKRRYELFYALGFDQKFTKHARNVVEKLVGTAHPTQSRMRRRHFVGFSQAQPNLQYYNNYFKQRT
ncbi:MAG: hypothetical protein K8R40_08005 [Anaerolineaceae bacterium]|nr:hypothetical protein [Anaerolineaceae bacterium]